MLALTSLLCRAQDTNVPAASAPQTNAPVASVPQLDNLLSNGDFKQADDKKPWMPMGWGVWLPDPGPGGIKGTLDMVALDGATMRDGIGSVRLSSKDVPTRIALNLAQPIDVTPGQRYRFTVYAKAENLEGNAFGARVRMEFSGGPGAGAHPPIYGMGPKAPNFDWTPITCEGVAPDDCNKLIVKLFLWNCKGTVWYNNAVINLLSNP